jgi:1-acyl-sn-glycerol-3-phosphate acyltransferase
MGDSDSTADAASTPPSPSATSQPPDHFPGPLARRTVSIPVVLFGVPLLVLLSPLVLLVGALVDVVTGAWRGRSVRAIAFAYCFAAIEWIALFRIGVLWVRTGFARRLQTDFAQDAMAELLGWYAHRILGALHATTRFTLDIQGLEVVDHGPLICVARHSSLDDALLPAECFRRVGGLRPRYMLKRELQRGPSFDFIGNWGPHHFVDRAPTDSAAQLVGVKAFAGGLGPRDVAVIFPEGTFFTPARQTQVMAKLEASDPVAAERARGLHYVLPPRPAGTQALLAAAPDADVLVLAHAGLEKFASIGRSLRAIPFREPVRAQLWRVPRADVPVDPDEQAAWLTDQFRRIDDWVDARTGKGRAS